MLARSPKAWGPAQQLKCWSEDGNPASHGTVQLRLRKPSNAPQGLGVMVAFCCRNGRIQAPRACGPGLQGAWGPGPQGLGPGPPGAWAFAPQPLKLRFFRKPPGGSLAKAWVSAETAASEVGTWRETKPGYPPYPPPPPPPHPPPPFWGCKGERKRVFTLSAFGNHPTRPPRSADIGPPQGII